MVKKTFLQKEISKAGKNLKTIENLIIDYVTHNSVRHQKEIINYLLSQDVSYTQSSLSRKLEGLGIHKINGLYKISSDSIFSSSKMSFSTLGQISIESVKTSPPNLIILKTLPGHGQALAYQLETQMLIKGIAGIIAGDDTVMIACSGEIPLGQMVNNLESI